MADHRRMWSLRFVESAVIDEPTLVVDASTSVKFTIADRVDALVHGHRLVAPPLMWSESTSALRNLTFRGEIDADEMRVALDRLLGAPVTPVRHPELYRQAAAIAARLGWAKTYDAEYVALAQLLDAPLVTVDVRLIRGARQYVDVVMPEQLDDR